MDTGPSPLLQGSFPLSVHGRSDTGSSLQAVENEVNHHNFNDLHTIHFRDSNHNHQFKGGTVNILNIS